MHKFATLWIVLSLWSLAQAQPGIRFKAYGAGSRPARQHSQGARVTPHLPRHFILEFRSYPGAEIRQELARREIRVLEYLPENGLMVSSDATPYLEGLDVAWAGPQQPEEKISPLLETQSSGVYLVVFHLDADMETARAVVRNRGFDVLENAALLPWQLLARGAFQDTPGLASEDLVTYILPASADLVSGAPVIGCAGALAEAGAVGEYVEVGRGWAKDSDGRVALHYSLQSLTKKLDESTVRGEIERALREWVRYANLSLTQAQPAAVRSIDILFAHGAHGDAYPFDGPGGALAHTFYPSPPNAEPVAGDMHLDTDEDWHAGTNVDLFTVALHEAGHALGLGHSDRPGAVMYPYYRLATGLTGDDIAGIRDLYGASAEPSQPPVQPPIQPPVQPPVEPPVPTPTPPPVTPPVPPPVPPASPAADNTPPAVSIQSPGFTIVSTSSATIAVSGTATDNVAVAAVKWTNSTGNSGVALGTATWSASVPLLVGNNVITIRAYDAAGNSGWRAITVVRR